MTYDDIRPIFENKFNSNVAFLMKTKEQIDEEDSRALKSLSESQDDKKAKKQKLDEEVEELKRHLQIVPNDEDDVYTEATPLALKVPVVDYEIYNENNKPYYKIKRADDSHQLWIKREFSVARTPQQNGITERKNRTLIEAARTMLADSLLLILFWAEAVHTDCYVQNKVLVTKPHNKTPYELLLGRTPSIRFMRPFGCPVTILNTLDPLGKIDEKADEGFLEKKHDDKTKREAKGKSHVDLSTGVRNLSEKFEDFSSNSTNWVNTASAPITAVEPNSTNSINSFNAVGPSNNAVSLTFEIDITYSDDEEDVGAEANFSNLETSITVNPIPTTKIHKDHPISQIIIDYLQLLKPEGHTQDEGIDYEEVFAPVAKIEAIRLFLAYASFKGFMRCVAFKKLMKDKFQMSLMGELTFFLGLQVKQKEDRIFISQDEYVAEFFRKFGPTDGKSASTPIDIEKHLLKDPDGEDVDVHTYRYLKGKPYLGLLYPKDSPFNVVAYSDSNYAGASLDRKSTTGGCQFLGCRLISWQCKKHTVIAASSTEAEYVAAYQVDEKDGTEVTVVDLMRVGKGFSGVDTPLFDGMLVPQQVHNDVQDATEDENDVNKVSAEPTPPSPRPATTPPPPQQELIPSPSHVESTPPPSPTQAQTDQPSSSPPQQPSQPEDISQSAMTILN
nr:putative ribonuclease H-like domain-containing protein [Tanacetum cinerariifolium]